LQGRQGGEKTPVPVERVSGERGGCYLRKGCPTRGKGESLRRRSEAFRAKEVRRLNWERGCAERKRHRITVSGRGERKRNERKKCTWRRRQTEAERNSSAPMKKGCSSEGAIPEEDTTKTIPPSRR